VKTIVITTIFPPTEGVRRFASRRDWELVVVGDRKTPANWRLSGTTYLSPDVQRKRFPRISKVVPWNHYSRKLIGYLEAIRIGSTTIVDADDDNIPKPGWGFPPTEGMHEEISGARGFVNVYQYFTRLPIWPRGLPLDLVLSPRYALPKRSRRKLKVGVWQGLADGDPDVDAIYRLTNNKRCVFADRAPIVLKPNTYSPFNSQNTLFCRKLFPLLYLPTSVSFRFTDILRSLVAQPIMAVAGYRLGFTKATVVQKRNPHDYLQDFESEIPCYLLGRKAIEAVGEAVHSSLSVGENLEKAYKALVKCKIVAKQELRTVALWLDELSK